MASEAAPRCMTDPIIAETAPMSQPIVRIVDACRVTGRSPSESRQPCARNEPSDRATSLILQSCGRRSHARGRVRLRKSRTPLRRTCYYLRRRVRLPGLVSFGPFSMLMFRT